ncbi:glycolipid 2-alpha-mannosyltransferase-domain-containing protein [Endogone sp. FLAS-F59071]|nr:glycolipid 2-alpha-mannosyltransferase-domain-containing protein [Endogone sp. FLAS-F59071]|eukprot:RUS15072.1 glycolipid 2-alpha-mannosyltransferase-domain-containing protein [Endogone sp. FLAS-F59071]
MAFRFLPQAGPRRSQIFAVCFALAVFFSFLSFYSLTYSRTDPSATRAATPATADTDFPPTTTTTDPVSAVFVILVRNSELGGIISSISQLEERFNWRFNYPYVFLNDDEFTDEFKQRTTALTRAQTFYGKVDVGMWGWPQWINQTLAREKMDELARNGVVYGGSESYRHMCRFQSGFFFRHPLLDSYDYYWRVEPFVDFYCDIEYDVFRFMKERKIKYGFTMTFREYMATIPTLWGAVKAFRDKYQELLTIPQEDTLWKFVTEDDGQSYNTCHFWTNFEIASLEIWRSGQYLKFFNYLDQTDGATLPSTPLLLPCSSISPRCTSSTTSGIGIPRTCTAQPTRRYMPSASATNHRITISIRGGAVSLSIWKRKNKGRDLDSRIFLHYQ